MMYKYKHGYPVEERKKHLMCILENIIDSVKTLLYWSDKLEIDGTKTNPEKDDDKSFLLALKPLRRMEKDVAERIKKFWRSDDGFMKTFENSAKFQLLDCAEYFLDRLDVISEDNYVPSKEDVFHCRTVTPGINDLEFQVEKSLFNIIDVGGQRSQRKKWIHCFSGVTAVIFFAAINEYDQVLFEEKKQNRMCETLNLFEDIVNSSWFEESIILLFLNKKDLFEKKIKKVPITTFFKNFKGNCHDVDGAIEHIKHTFLKASNRGDEIYTHVTNATDSNNINVVFNAVKDTILKSNLKRGGFI